MFFLNHCRFSRNKGYKCNAISEIRSSRLGHIPVIYVAVMVLPGSQGATCAFAGSLLTRPRGAAPGVGAGRPPETVGNALGGSGQAFRPTIVLHSEGSEFCLKNNSVFHANPGRNGSPGFNRTLGGGQGRSARLKD